MTTRADVFGGGENERRETKEGRKERSLDFTRRHAHTERAVCKCVQSDRQHFAARCSCAFISRSFSISSPSLSLVLPRLFSRVARHTDTHPVLQREKTRDDTMSQPYRPPPPPPLLVPRRATTGRSFGRSVGPQALFRPRWQEARKVASLSTAYE